MEKGVCMPMLSAELLTEFLRSTASLHDEMQELDLKHTTVSPFPGAVQRRFLPKGRCADGVARYLARVVKWQEKLQSLIFPADGAGSVAALEDALWSFQAAPV
jgi:hypothetical protein